MPRYQPKSIGINVLIRDQVSFQTWLLIGALLQSALVHFVRPPYSFLPAILCTAYITLTYLLESFGSLGKSTTPPVNYGRFTAQPPTADTGVTVFLLGFQSSHPLRLMAPGTKTIGDHFNHIFDEAEKNPEESGLLGRCGPLLDAAGEGGNAMFTISYWKTQKHLKDWHSGEAHSNGMKWYYKSRSKYPYLGLMHEIYDCPAGNFENVYINFRPFGFRQTKWLVDGEQVAADIDGGGTKKIEEKFKTKS